MTGDKKVPEGAPAGVSDSTQLLDSPRTMKEMCEVIVTADILRKKDGTAPTAMEIFESSPTGELYQVFMWYEMAKSVLESNGPLNRRAD